MRFYGFGYRVVADAENGQSGGCLPDGCLGNLLDDVVWPSHRTPNLFAGGTLASLVFGKPSRRW